MMRSSLLLVFAMVLPLACGGDEKQAKTAEAADEPRPREDAREESGNRRSLADHRRAFMDGCLGRVRGGADYCDCGWEQMVKTFSEEEMNSESKPDESKLEAVRERTAASCLGKLPEANVREDFVKDCAGGNAKLDPYCDCAWAELRKTLSIADFADKKTMESRRFAEAKKGMATKCSPKMPEQVVRDEFMRGCMKVDAEAKALCACVWKTLRTKMSPAEIASADEPDLAVHGEKVRAACGKLRAKK